MLPSLPGRAPSSSQAGGPVAEGWPGRQECQRAPLPLPASPGEAPAEVICGGEGAEGVLPSPERGLEKSPVLCEKKPARGGWEKPTRGRKTGCPGPSWK